MVACSPHTPETKQGLTQQNQRESADASSSAWELDAELAPRTDEGWQALVAAAEWEIVPADEDPFAANYPSGSVSCGWGDLRLENGGIEIDTGACNLVALRQPLMESLPADAQLSLKMWWQTLVSIEPATGDLALALGGTRIWQHQVSIPGPADAIEPLVRVKRSFEAGTPIYFHLSNHGSNTWNLNQITWRRP